MVENPMRNREGFGVQTIRELHTAIVSSTILLGITAIEPVLPPTLNVIKIAIRPVTTGQLGPPKCSSYYQLPNGRFQAVYTTI